MVYGFQPSVRTSSECPSLRLYTLRMCSHVYPTVAPSGQKQQSLALIHAEGEAAMHSLEISEEWKDWDNRSKRLYFLSAFKWCESHIAERSWWQHADEERKVRFLCSSGMHFWKMFLPHTLFKRMRQTRVPEIYGCMRLLTLHPSYYAQSKEALQPFVVIDPSTWGQYFLI